MPALNLKSLVGHLNDTSRRALESAAGLCLSRTQYNVEIEHWLLRLIEDKGCDVPCILRRFEIDSARLVADLNRELEQLKTGNTRPPALSQNVVDLAREAWLVASLDFDATRSRSGHVLIALLETDALASQIHEVSAEFEKISVETLRREFDQLIAKSTEGAESADAPRGAGALPGKPAGSGKTPGLDQFTVDLTARAKGGEIDPVIGRDGEIRQVIDILTRRRQNNPILTGEAGVGKTAVAEGFALRIAQGDVPPPLRNVSVRVLDLALLQAGAGVKGEFENRLKSVIQEVKSSPTPIILFIDEAHTLVGAGGQAGQGDAANLIKPALARGELRTIAATTWAEYKKYFERDAALARRFQVVKVEEPDEQTGIQIMTGLTAAMEKHHGVRVLDEAIVASVKLSMRYISGRQLPDKSVSLLDTASARVALSQNATPAAIEDCRRRIAELGVSEAVLNREHATRPIHAERLAELARAKVETSARLTELEQRWKREMELVKSMRELRVRIEGGSAASNESAKPTSDAKPGQAQPAPLSAEERDRLVSQLARMSEELRGLQGENPLVQESVDAQSVAAVVSNWTGIPVGRMVSDQIKTVLHLKGTLEKRIVGQNHALEALARSIRINRANLADPTRPIGVFMLVGTSGVGKTETAIALTELLYGGDQNMTVLNMSEFKEEHKVSLLMGSPPGYVGYGEGGVLTEAVRRKPYSVVLLDEIEKAHPGVQDVFYQVFDKGSLRDGEGRDIDFRNTVILMTTNAGTQTIMSLCADPETMPDEEGLREALRPELLKTFKPAFLGRVTIVPYFPLRDEALKGIVRLKLDKIVRRVWEHYKAPCQYSPELIDLVVSRCKEVESGARTIDHILTRTMLPELATECLSRMADGRTIRAIRIGVDANGRFTYSLDEG